MSVWMELKRALTLMDVATRNWGRELGLDECSVMVLALLGEGGASPGSSLAAKCGRSRSHVHRSLRILEERLYATRNVVAGRTESWELTQRGRRLWRCLDRGIRAFEAELEPMPTLRSELERIVTIFLNRPRGKHGWRFGLSVPLELLKMPIGVEASLEGLLDSEPAVTATADTPGDEEDGDLKPPPGHWPKPWTAADREVFKCYWELRRQSKGGVCTEEAREGEDPVQSP